MDAAQATYTPMSLGEAIVIARDRAGLTQEELAERIGVHFKTLSRWERSVTTAPPFAAVVRIAWATGQSLRWFVDTVPGLSPSDVRSTTRYAAQLVLPFEGVATVHDIDAERQRRRAERTAQVLGTHTRLRLA